ncbi:AAA family ATPase [Vibrio parahaemolyticus]|uniref:AAA family ATPase n=1 Tax=Vibrio parahaemolyticus TaxID=670 RepID=UPI001120C545|nr:AAA family ATPase [Vibrio parahaemolyticus]TNY71405.1 hypothetical protein CGK63_16310 [Vibrio parahaemolyticus]
MKNISMIFKKLIIVGIEKEYSCQFEEGLNLIWGDMDSGKSSILNLIDYALGGDFKKLQLDYDELRSKGRYVHLEVEFNNEIVTIERVLGSNIDTIKLYHCTRDQIDETYPLICGASSTSDEPDGWISDRILDLLGIPKVRIKESKYRDDSGSDRLSFRDLMKLVYLKQKRVASDMLMDAHNHSVHNKNIEIQKFIYGVHDDQLSELNKQLQEQASSEKVLSEKTKGIRDFLKSTGSLTDNTREYESVSKNIKSIDEEIEKLKSSKEHAAIVSNEINKKIQLLVKNIKEIDVKINNNEQKLSSYSKLKTTYVYDIDCLKTSNRMRSILTASEKEKSTATCPTCSSSISLSDSSLDDSDIEYEMKSLKNRLVGCEEAIKRLLVTIKEQISTKQALENNLNEYKMEFDKDNLVNLSPTINSIVKAESIKRTLAVQHSVLKKNIMLSNKLDEQYTQIQNIKINITKIKDEIKKIEEDLGNIDDVLEALSSEFVNIMKKSKLTNNYGSGIDKKFMPVFRDRNYEHISSGGVRTILSVNLYLSRLRYILKKGAFLPRTLMLDTPGQNIGRYARKSESETDKENLSDPSIYEGIYSQLKSMSSLSNGEKYQILVVDNDLPNCLSQSDYHLVKRFDKTDSNYDKGLINDA